MIIECLICKKKIYSDITKESGCPGLHKKLVDVYGYYDKGMFRLSKSGQKKLAESGKEMV